MTHYNAQSGQRRYQPDETPERPPRPSPLPKQDEAPPPPPRAKTPPGPLRELGRGLDGILSRLDPSRLATEDLLVLAVLWLLYRESGEKELLFALGAYLFL